MGVAINYIKHNIIQILIIITIVLNVALLIYSIPEEEVIEEIYIEHLEPENIYEIDNKNELQILKAVQSVSRYVDRNITITFPVQSQKNQLKRLEVILEKINRDIEMVDRMNKYFVVKVHFKVLVLYSSNELFSESAEFTRLFNYYQEVFSERFQFSPVSEVIDNISDFEYKHSIPPEKVDDSLLENYNYNKPDKQSRQETLNLYSTLSFLNQQIKSKNNNNIGSKKDEERDEYIYIMNDLIPICDNSLSILGYLLSKADVYNPDWKALKLSQSWNGFIMKSSDLETLGGYIKGNRHIKKLKFLIEEWICGMSSIGLQRTAECPQQNRNLFIFKYHLFHDVALQDTTCWLSFINTRKCKTDDIIPCLIYEPSNPYIYTNVDYLTHYIKSEVAQSILNESEKEVKVNFVKKHSNPLYQSIYNYKSTQEINSIEQHQTHNNIFYFTITTLFLLIIIFVYLNFFKNKHHVNKAN